MVYLIDTENVKSAWLEALITEEKGNINSKDKIMVMYTNNTPKLHYDEIALLLEHFSEQIDLRKCRCGKPNALDFQIIAMIAIMAKENVDESFTIISDDTGFDTAIELYKEAGIQVKRSGVQKKTEVNDVAASENKKLSNVQLKELRKKQREFLTNRCKIPKTMAEQVRKWLEKGLKDAEKGIEKSKAKAFKSGEKVKKHAIEGIKKNWKEYCSIKG